MLTGVMPRETFRPADRARSRGKKPPLAALALALVLAPAFALAQGSALPARADDAPVEERAQPDPFEADGFEVELGASAYVSIQKTSERRPQIDDLGAHLRFGWMLTSPAAEGLWRGNTELLVSAQGSAVLVGPGHAFAGGSLAVRRNFVQPGARIVPYAQLEVGALHNDVHENGRQRVVGQDFEFQLGGGVGARYRIGDAWAAYAEVDYRHVSNGGLSNRNLGLNSAGALFGLSRFF
ncbi:MAG: acyloxyacyl hydrolase [Myxococcota bacterium]